MFFGMALILLPVVEELRYRLGGNILRINQVPIISRFGQLEYLHPDRDSSHASPAG